MQRKQQMEQSHADRQIEGQTHAINKIKQREYYKPNEFMNQACSFYVKSLDQRQRDKAEQMFLGARLNRSLHNTLR